ncbi:hypothetical protein RHMOL_Rhmol05G0309300 [Rhododendron molle]|uniref:Uncharacterized protein n=1 Tax=Rhododendron molle TaxID=49168 RepID=A0ACC0NUS3_RHOML|nr:hypothetical protein RHMOL_Rhmol05G0309300 [Rhododendron molle]
MLLAFGGDCYGEVGENTGEEAADDEGTVINLVDWDEGWGERRAKLEAIKKRRAMEPCCDGKLVFDAGRVAALLVLGNSAPLPNEKHTFSIPPRIFYYAVELLAREVFTPIFGSPWR